VSELVKGIFGLLNDWRNMPNYQLERRLDIFFAYFLPIILKSMAGECGIDTEKHEYIIPEFPLWIGANAKGKKKDNKSKKELIPLPVVSDIEGKLSGFTITRHSKKVDYVVIDKTDATAYFIELKTTNESIDEQQAFNLAEIYNNEKKSWRNLVAEALYISERNNSYKPLINRLIKLEVIDALTPERFYLDVTKDKESPESLVLWSREITKKNDDVLALNLKIIPVFIIPSEKNTIFLNEDGTKAEKYKNIKIINFSDIISIINKEEVCPAWNVSCNSDTKCFCGLLKSIKTETDEGER